jgi:hypothetical protein
MIVFIAILQLAKVVQIFSSIQNANGNRELPLNREKVAIK